MLKLRIDPWGPEYEGGLQLPADGEEEVPADVDLTVEQSTWEAIRPSERARPRLVFVDGVRRVEVRLLADLDGETRYGLFGAVGAGAVAITGQHAETLPPKVRRVIVMGGGLAGEDVTVPGIAGSIALPFGWQPTADNTPAAPLQELQRLMREAEAVIAQEQASHPETWVIADGPLVHRRSSPARILGYVKRLQRVYLPPAAASLLPVLPVAHRTPLFLVRDPAGRFGRYSWYIRLAVAPPIAHPLAGIVRLEISTGAGLARAREAGDVSAGVLPDFASTPERDPRAPQNLLPIGALERALRHALGDPQWIRRMLVAYLNTAEGLA
jgi:hypothetical protein